MKIYHDASAFDHYAAQDPTKVVARMERNIPEIYQIFLQFQEALVTPYLKRDGVVGDDLYDSLLPIAANLTLATAASAQDFNEEYPDEDDATQGNLPG